MGHSTAHLMCVTLLSLCMSDGMVGMKSVSEKERRGREERKKRERGEREEKRRENESWEEITQKTSKIGRDDFLKKMAKSNNFKNFFRFLLRYSTLSPLTSFKMDFLFLSFLHFPFF